MTFGRNPTPVTPAKAGVQTDSKSARNGAFSRGFLSKKASDGERRFIEAMVHARTNRGANFALSIPLLEELAADYPGERLPPVLLGQLYNNDNRRGPALVWFKKAQAIGTSLRIEAFIANDDLFQARYAEARTKFQAAGGAPLEAVKAVVLARGLGTIAGGVRFKIETSHDGVLDLSRRRDIPAVKERLRGVTVRL